MNDVFSFKFLTLWHSKRSIYYEKSSFFLNLFGDLIILNTGIQQRREREDEKEEMGHKEVTLEELNSLNFLSLKQSFALSSGQK